MTTAPSITTLLFDIDDTLYPIKNGFTAHRNNDVALNYMVDRLGFADHESAAAFRLPYFTKYHSTMKALAVAAGEGKLPPLSDGSQRPFSSDELATYWAANARFSDYIARDDRLAEVLASLKEVDGLRIMIFSNGPRAYALRVLETLGVRDCFADSDIFAVDDLLPHCKPEAAAFEKVLTAAGVQEDPSQAVLFEDSMKNVRAAKALGMRTVLLLPSAEVYGSSAADAPDPSDPAVDAVLEECRDMKERLPCLWEKKWAP